MFLKLTASSANNLVKFYQSQLSSRFVYKLSGSFNIFCCIFSLHLVKWSRKLMLIEIKLIFVKILTYIKANMLTTPQFVGREYLRPCPIEFSPFLGLRIFSPTFSVIILSWWKCALYVVSPYSFLTFFLDILFFLLHLHSPMALEYVAQVTRYHI